jgi:hypothetical protein
MGREPVYVSLLKPCSIRRDGRARRKDRPWLLIFPSRARCPRKRFVSGMSSTRWIVAAEYRRYPAAIRVTPGRSPFLS